MSERILCQKSGCGVCLHCSEEYKQTVYCRDTIAQDYEIAIEIVMDMAKELVRLKRFKTIQECIEFYKGD